MAMKIDKTLVAEIRGLNSFGDRSAKVKFAEKMREAVADLSNPNVMTAFGDILSKHGRAVTALCVAATIRSRADMLNSAAVDWAEAVLDSFEDPARAVRLGAYNDNLHPSRVETYASNLMKYTTEG